MGEHALVLITCGSEREAGLIARNLVDEGLAAGVQMIPIRSVYRWEDKVVDDKEWLLLVKTRSERYPSIERRVGELHSYQVPPVLMIDIGAASAADLEWIDEQVATP
jgi:periplasmic divalent cation tolerance protein